MTSDRAVDAKIAEKVMGWKPNVASNFPEQMQPPDDSSVVRSVPHYTTDIAAAWQVVEKMRNRDLGDGLLVWCIHITEMWQGSRPGGWWCAILAGRPHEAVGKPIAAEHSNSPARAICLAALATLTPKAPQ